MFRRFIYFFFIYTFIIISPVFVFPQNNSEADTMVINSINIRGEKGDIAAESVDFEYASRWAHSMHLVLLPDSPPAVDSRAFLLTQYQTVIPVSGYKKDLLYSIYFDFFKFSEKDLPFNTILKIYVRDIYGNKRLIGTADSRKMKEKKIFEVSVPFDLSYPGKFDIILNEYSEKTGNWGIWDIIISSKKLNEIEIIPADSTEKIKEIELKIFK